MLGFGPETKQTQEQQQLHEGARASGEAAALHPTGNAASGLAY